MDERVDNMHLHLSVISFLSVYQVVSAVVEEREVSYCCKGQSASLYVPEKDRKCEQSWAKGTASLAHFKDGEGKCALPCMAVSHGNLTLSECDVTTNVTLTSVCLDEKGAQMEERIHFYPGECPNFESVGIALAEAHRLHYGACIPPIVLIVLIVIVMALIISCKHHGNNADGLPL